MKKYLNIIFITIFLIICLIPTFNVNTKKLRAYRELRHYAEFKPLIMGGRINNNFGRDFDNWFSDRFFLRPNLIDIYSNFKYTLCFENYILNTDLINKKSHWFFYGITANKEYAPQDWRTDKIIESLDRLNDYFAKQNTKLYVMIIPSKTTLYEEETSVFRNQIQKFSEMENNILKILMDNSRCKIIYPYEELMEAKKKDYIFYKVDHHWTDYGAYIGYKALSKEIKKDFPQYNTVDLKDFYVNKSKYIRSDIGREFSTGSVIYAFPLRMNILYNFLDTEYTYYDYKKTKNTRMYYDRENYTKYHITPKSKNKLKLLLLGVSYNESLQQYLPYSVKELLYLRFLTHLTRVEDEFKMYKRFNNKISEYQPDIAVLCVGVEQLYRLLDLFED